MSKTAESLKKFLNEKKLSYAKFADKIGYSKTAIARFIKGSYEGEELDKKVKDFLEEYNRDKGLRWGFIETRTVKMINEVCNLSYGNADMGVIYGNAGFGKTTALQRYATQNGDFAAYLKCYITSSGRILMIAIKKALGLSDTGYKNSHQLMEEVIDFLCAQHRLLIIDEADLLSVRALEMLRAIFDDSQCGMVLCGLPRLLMNLTVGPQAKDNLAQLYSRVGIQVQIPNISYEKLQKILHSYKITEQKIVDVFFKKVKSGGMRKLAKILMRSLRLAEINRSKVTEKIIEKAEGLLI